MKLWEAMRLLEEDPSRKFEHQDDQKKWLLYAGSGCCSGRVFYMLDCWNNEGELITEYRSGSLRGNLSTLDNWQPVRQSVWQPITWQEAIQAWVEGKTVTVSTMFGLGSREVKKSRGSSITEYEITKGTWYVEE